MLFSRSHGECEIHELWKRDQFALTHSSLSLEMRGEREKDDNKKAFNWKYALPIWERPERDDEKVFN